MGKTRIKLTLAEEIWTTWRKTANGRTPDAQISEGLERMVEDDETRWGAKDKVHGLRRQRGLDHPLRKPTTTMQKLRIDEVLLHKAADALSRTETTGSYCQIWCTTGCSCGGSAVLDDLDAVVEPDSLNDLREVAEST